MYVRYGVEIFYYFYYKIILYMNKLMELFYINSLSDDNFLSMILLIERKIKGFRSFWNYTNYEDNEKEKENMDELLDLIQDLKVLYRNQDIESYKKVSKIFFEKLNNSHIEWYN